MDAFFAAVEQRDYPYLRGKPIAVGSTERRGVVATCSYEARVYGVRSAMPSYRAKELCPHIIFIKPHMDQYRDASRQIREILLQYTDLVEFASIDEAYLDVTDNKLDIDDPMKIGKMIKDEIKEHIKITASIGVSVNKLIAKIASDLEKPDGLTMIAENQIDVFLDNLPIEKLRGVGTKTTERMKEFGIWTVGKLKTYDQEELIDMFGKKRGEVFFRYARGIDERPVDPEPQDRKSIGVSETYQFDIIDDKLAYEELKKLAEKISQRQEMKKLYGRTVTVKIRYRDFKTVTRSLTTAMCLTKSKHILLICVKLLKSDPLKKPVRLFGITMSNLHSNKFFDYAENAK